MTPDIIVDLFRQSLWLAITVMAVLLVPALIVGLLVAMFQAATQINEMSLSFIPKLLVTFLTLIFAGPWLLKTMMNCVLICVIKAMNLRLRRIRRWSRI